MTIAISKWSYGWIIITASSVDEVKSGRSGEQEKEDGEWEEESEIFLTKCLMTTMKYHYWEEVLRTVFESVGLQSKAWANW